MAKLEDLHKVRMYEESDNLIDEWDRPSKRSEAERRMYGPKLVEEKIAFLREFNKKAHKKPEVLAAIRADLAEREAAHPDKSRFDLRLQVIHDQMKNNKKLGLKSRYYKTPGIGLYEMFKGRKIADDIFGDDLVTTKVEKKNAEQGLVDTPAPIHLPAKKASPKPTKKASPKPTKKASPKPAKKASPKPTKKASPKPTKKASPKPTKKASPPKSKTAKKTKRKRCPNGTRRNKKTGNCDPKKN